MESPGKSRACPSLVRPRAANMSSGLPPSRAPKAAAEEKEKEKERKKKKKAPSSSTQAPAAQERAKGPGHKRPLTDASEPKATSQTGEAAVKHKKSSSKRSEHTKTGKVRAFLLTLTHTHLVNAFQCIPMNGFL